MGISFVMANEVAEELAKGALKKIDLVEGNIQFPADIVVLREKPMMAPVRKFSKNSYQEARREFSRRNPQTVRTK